MKGGWWKQEKRKEKKSEEKWKKIEEIFFKKGENKHQMWEQYKSCNEQNQEKKSEEKHDLTALFVCFSLESSRVCDLNKTFDGIIYLLLITYSLSYSSVSVERQLLCFTQWCVFGFPGCKWCRKPTWQHKKKDTSAVFGSNCSPRLLKEEDE